MIKIGTRGSKLALWQANWTQAQLKENGYEAQIDIIRTKGDVVKDRFDKMEGKGFFTAEIEHALLNGDVDLAVHCLKDLPTQSPPGLKIVAIPEREDARDCLVSKKPLGKNADGTFNLNGLTVGTSSNRRVAGLKVHSPEAEFVPIRGNVPTRIQKMVDGAADVIVLAQAGLNRLDIQQDDLHFYPLSVDELVPAPAQGALAMQVRENETRALDFLHHAPSAAASDGERRVLRAMEGGCQMPLGVYIEAVDGAFQIRVFRGAHGNSDEPLRFQHRAADITTLVDETLEALKLT
ncbi:hydroxymethylbilane synthase [Acanthopleuribacter pedis]|uniref:Hydroxymethylbilane synthase n=1 Tax=Acanthopleuribacter pedis TaxID=442870 RepID=A0A8J7U3A2_9BACT|nr:hydroxymethylbilane synthase [Acanthopleuribacter pedis]MBO1317061.1 hydroxymethylbilane synthase [Acanthopleuribacter pedis]